MNRRPTATVWMALVLAASVPAARASPMTAQQFDQVFSAAIERNDVAALERYLAPEWFVISGDGARISRARFLQVIKSGALQHRSMQSSEEAVRALGDVVIIAAHARSRGSYQGVDFETDEIATDVVARIHGRWQCVLTQLTMIAPKATASVQGAGPRVLPQSDQAT
jgi:ketosteroid isomerase-like protein